MGNETILYYAAEETITGVRRNIKMPFWRKIKPSSFVVETEEVTVTMLLIPALQKGWKPDKLLRFLQRDIAERSAYGRNPEIMIHPALGQLLGQTAQQYARDSWEQDLRTQEPQRQQTDTFLPIFWSLSAKLLAAEAGLRTESVLLLLGSALFPEEQIEKFDEMIQPYLSRINHLTIAYDGREDFLPEWEHWEEVIEEYVEEIYYEYGLVSQIVQDVELQSRQYKNSMKKGAFLVLDFGYEGSFPWRALQAGSVYLDVASCEKKRLLLQKKYREVSYLSPWKYLDTVVKSGYDKLVNQA
ncbi:MAG: hypothetical protein NC318_05775 [Blautia sp.]|nr:hypothetical protein [Lachnoclostridium sp.]MCM1211094.1 hypothetical protein [Blautia sp.]